MLELPGTTDPLSLHWAASRELDVTGIVGLRRGSLRPWTRGCELLSVSELRALVVVWCVGYRHNPLTQGDRRAS